MKYKNKKSWKRLAKALKNASRHNEQYYNQILKEVLKTLKQARSENLSVAVN